MVYMTGTLGLRERKKLGTRWALSDAALELALERGLENVTREDIANRAGVSLRTFNNYFTGKYEAVAFRQVDRTRQSLAAFRERPADEPLWSAITEAMLQPLEAEGAADMRPTPGELAVIRELLSARDLRAAMTRELFADWVDAIAERTETDPARDMYPRLVAAVIRVVEDLPFVPTTWIERKRSCGESSAVMSRRIRSSPRRSARRCSAPRRPPRWSTGRLARATS